MLWQFMVYVAPGGRCDVQGEIDRIDDYGREQFWRRIRYLSVTAIVDWHEPSAKKMSGHKELYEIRFKAAREQVRPLGYFGPENNQFTIVIWSAKKGEVYKPASAFESAARRWKEIRNGNATVQPLKIDGEDVSQADEE